MIFSGLACKFVNMKKEPHIGNYIKAKLKERGETIASLAEMLNTTRQNLSQTYLKKPFLPYEMMDNITKVMGDSFFREYIDQLPLDSQYQDYFKVRRGTPVMKENKAPLKTESGFAISIQIDPDNFDPVKLDILSSSLKKALEDYQRRTTHE